MVMDILAFLKVAEVIKECGEKTLNDSKLATIVAKIDALTQISSEIILRDLRGAFKSLQDHLACSPDSGESHVLLHAEESFLKNTGLDVSLQLGTVSAADIVALSYFGLAFINSSRGDHRIAYRYVLRMFETTSRLARIDLSPAVFERLFKQYCSGCFQEHLDRVKRQADFGDYCVQAGRGLYGAVIGLGGIMLGFAHPLGRQVTREVSKHVGKVWEEGANSKEWKSMEELQEELQKSLDITCAEVAKQMLAGSVKPELNTK